MNKSKKEQEAATVISLKSSKSTILAALKKFLPWNYYMPGHFELIDELLDYLPTEKVVAKYGQMLKEIDFSLLEDALNNKLEWEESMSDKCCGECTKTYAYELSKVISIDDLRSFKLDFETLNH